MHKLTRIAIALSAVCAASGAHAQSSVASPNVTFYGIIDAYAQTARGASTVQRVQSGGLMGSRFGLRGTEDLGSGLRAFYVLEGGSNTDDGSSAQGGLLFGRQALVGLGSERFGQISLGRQQSAVYYVSTEFSAFSCTTAGPTTAVIGGFAGGYEPVRGASGTATPPAAGATGNGGPVRVNNSVRYESPSLAGFHVGALYGAGEVANAVNDSRLVDLFARYSAGVVEVLASRMSDKATGLARADVTTTSLGAKVAIGSGHVFAGLIDVDDRRPENEDGRGYWLGGDYAFGAHVVRAQYIVNDPRFGKANRTQAFGVGYEYDLSKRTALYSSLTRFANQANAGPGGLGRWNSAIPTGLTRVGSNDITELVGGIRHMF